MFIVKKQAVLCPDSLGFEHNDWINQVQIPVGSTHPGAFAFERRHHIHEGVDIYTLEHEHVYLPERLWVQGWMDFTGPSVGMPWWNDTKALICHTACGKTVIFGEIVPCQGGLGLEVQSGWMDEGVCIGQVHPVLKVDKGRPRHMVHVEMYDRIQNQSIGLWQKAMQKPAHLMDPTPWLVRWADLNSL